MTAYYNEIDHRAAAWLRELIAAALIAPGDVDERSIVDVQPDDLRGYDQCHFFAGLGVWSYALRLAGFPDDRPVWTGSVPCQPLSLAGKQLGPLDQRHLWPAFYRLIAQCEVPVLFGEQVAGKLGMEWFAGVRHDLEGIGYACGCADLTASGLSAPHIRQRLYWVGHASRYGRRGRGFEEHPQQQGTLGLQPHGPSARGPGDGPDGTLANAQERGQREFGRADRQRDIRHAHGGVASGPVADATGGRRHPRIGFERPTGGETDFGRDCDPRGVGDAASPRREGTGQHGDGTALQSARPQQSGPSGTMGDPPGKGLEERHDERGDAEQKLKAAERAGGRPYWADYDLVPCTDGKARRTEPGAQPLVDGTARRVVPSGDPGASYARNTAEARTMRLRGYGNAIVAPVATEFIRAAMEAITDANS